MPPVTAGLNRLFQSTLPLRGATSTRYPRHPRNRFQSTLPLRGATRGKPRMILRAPISIHTPLAGSDFANALAEQEEKNFNPHSPCGERHCAKRTVADNQISIHTPLAGSDTIGLSIVFFRCISIHTPLAGSDVQPARKIRERHQFQSTLPLRGATSTTARAPVKSSNFNPHSPCGERRIHPSLRQQKLCISIHTPLAGSDVIA